MEDTNFLDGAGVPLGFGMLLMQHTDAMLRFKSLSSEEQKSILDGAHHCDTREKMEHYVEQLVQNRLAH